VCDYSFYRSLGQCSEETWPNSYINKPVVEAARDVQCCVHTRDSSCRGQTHRWTAGWRDTVRQ